jgi:hypothetical protein
VLRFYRLPYYDGKFQWEISPLTGNLLKSKYTFFEEKNLPIKIKQALFCIDQPYNVKWSHLPRFPEIEHSKKDEISSFNRTLFKLGNKNFLLSILYSFYTSSKFKTTTEAFSFISTLENHHYGSENCFQRSLLAAKISRSFKDKGVLFIGAEICSFNMHAWVIEEDSQPDFEDRVWINYRPLLAIVFR